ncbi:hypothetical protein GBF38_022381, partial [Nibea albiflora]
CAASLCLSTYYSLPPQPHPPTTTITTTTTTTTPPPTQSCKPPSIRLTVAMVTITTPWRQQWEADWEGGEGKAALRDERKMMAAKDKSGGKVIKVMRRRENNTRGDGESCGDEGGEDKTNGEECTK